MENRVVKTETTKEMGLEKKTGARPSVVVVGGLLEMSKLDWEEGLTL